MTEELRHNFEYVDKLKIPKGQKLQEAYIVEGKPKYIVTSDLFLSKFTLFEIQENWFLVKIEANSTPKFKKIKIGG